jgi:succinyl-diaminopimelate desuccinylase
MNNDLTKYLSALVHYKSITPLSAGSIEYINKILLDLGFTTEIKIFGNEEYKVTNLYAALGDESPNICFAGHVDVVPPGDFRFWDYNPFLATFEKGRVFGRGVVDMKGALACALAATKNFLESYKHPNGTLSFLITSDEEGRAEFGTKKMLSYLYSQPRFNKIDLAILGEPTCEQEIGDLIKIGRRGSVNCTLTLYGAQGHVAYPQLSCNPVYYLVKILNDLVDYNLGEKNELFQSSNLELTSIDVDNNATNVIPQEASAKFNIRFNNSHSADSLVNLINKVISKYSIQYKLTYNVSAEPFIQEPSGIIEDFAKIVRETTGITTRFSTSGGTSDARFLRNYCKVVEFGLLSSTAHKINEYAKINDLQRLYDVYYNALKRFLY